MTVIALTIEEAAARLKVHPASLRVWVREARIPAIKLGGHWRVTEETIDAVLRGDLALTKPKGRPKGAKNKPKKAPKRRK